MTAMQLAGWVWIVVAIGFLIRVVLPLIWHGDLHLNNDDRPRPRGEPAPATKPAGLAP